MKKILFILPFFTLLCACSPMQAATDSVPAVTTPAVVEYANPDSSVFYKTVSEFLESDFCNQMKLKGFTPYVLSYDEARYELLELYSDFQFYTIYLKDLREERQISYTITYDSDIQTVKEMDDNIRVSAESLFMTTEKDGQTFDVYISKSPFAEAPKYSLGYLPFEKYEVYINSDSPTPEEAIAYIHEFDLVAAE